MSRDSTNWPQKTDKISKQRILKLQKSRNIKDWSPVILQPEQRRKAPIKKKFPAGESINNEI